MTDWIIRRAEQADAPSLTACIDAAYSIYAGKGIDLPAVSDGIAEDIRENFVWVAILKRRIVGGLVLILRQDYAMLANVAVDPAAAGLGLGRALIEQAEQEVKLRGHSRMRLTTHTKIPENLDLYTHLGWRETGRDGNKVFMEKSL
jgi:GNAT superfamily N-acetyltransferase